MVPIYCPPVVVSHAVLAEEAAIIRAEGWYHVGGKYIPSAPLADNARRVEAECRVAERERLERNKLSICAFCYESIPNGVIPVTIAIRSVHPHCAEAFDQWISESPAENDPRWNEVTGDSLVLFDDAWTPLRELAGNERQTLSFNTNGVLEGGLPL